MNGRLRYLLEAVSDELRNGHDPLSPRFVEEHDVSHDEFAALCSALACGMAGYMESESTCERGLVPA